MALVKCPECGRENVSSTAKPCPGCGYNIKAYYETEQQKEVVSNTAAPTNKINVKAIIGVAVACIVIFCIYYFSTRCAFDGCTEKRTENSKYCAYHSLSYSYGSSYDYVPKTGNAGAKAKAESYLNSSAFSYTGLIDQLEYNGFSESEAKYGADNCGADWKEQALKKAKSSIIGGEHKMKGLIDMSATTVIKDILEAKGKSQIELAEEINVTRQNLSNKMNRDKFSSLELVEIADALEMNLILRDKNIDSIINDYKEYMKDNEISDEDIETTTSYVKPFVQFLLEKQEHIIDYPEDKKGKSKRNMTEEEKKAAQKKSEETKARNAKKQAESQDN